MINLHYTKHFFCLYSNNKHKYVLCEKCIAEIMYIEYFLSHERLYFNNRSHEETGSYFVYFRFRKPRPPASCTAKIIMSKTEWPELVGLVREK